MNPLEKRLLDRSARIGILGMGYVGLPLAVAFAKKGFSVAGFDVDKDRIRRLRDGKSHIPDVPSQTVAELGRSGHFEATFDFNRVEKCDALIICVPTPLRKSREPDVSYILEACRKIGRRLRRGQLVVLESTTYPGTTRELVLPCLERGAGSGRSGLKAGRDFWLAFSPERVDPGNTKYRIDNTPKIVGGLTPVCLKLAAALYGQVVDKVVPVSSPEAAEMIKLLENTFRAVNIGLVNEVALMCDRLKLDVWEILEGAATKPFGYMPFYPGPGIGGHCIPLDPSYLAWKMKALNFEPRFIELATVINGQMPEYTVRKMSEILNAAGKPVKNSRIFILGVAYKPQVSDVRESPALDVIKLLMDLGARIDYHDPFVPSLKIEEDSLRSIPLTKTNLLGHDLVAIMTAHRDVDYSLALKHAKIMFDARNATSGASRKGLFRL